MAPFYSILFEISICQFNSSKCSPIMPDEVREHLTRDQRPFLHPESLQTFRFTASPLQFTSLIFYRVQIREHLTRDQRPFLHSESLQTLQIHSFSSSVHLTHLLQGSDQRTPDTRSETIPSSRITPDLQIHSFSSSVHLTHLLQGSDQRTPDPRSETIPSSRITPDPSDSQLLLFSSPHSSSTGFRSENTWHEIRDHSFIQNHSRSSDSQLLLFSSPHSSSTGFRSENTWQEIRDHSFIQNHSRPFRFTASPLQFTSLIFYRVQIREHLTRDQRPFLHPESLQILQIHSFSSSVHLTHLLQGSGQRTPDPRSETIPSSRITPDLQIHSFFSSVHSLIFYRVQIREHLTRDQRPFLHPESLQILQIHSFFSSVHLTHLLQGSGQRTPDTRSETIPSSRITPDPSDSQLLLFSSPHSSSTGFRSENTWHEIRDHSFIQNHSRSSDSQLLLFSSPHSSSTGFRSENTWPEIRDHSFIQNHSRSFRFTASPLQFTSLIFYRVQVREHLTRDQRPFLHPESLQILQIHVFFSSVHLTHLLQGSDQKTPDKRSETIPSSRITPDLQIHSFFSSVHSLIFYRVQIREHLTRDQRPFLHPESLQTLQIHSFSSSVHLTHLLQGSDQRTPDKRSETIPSSRISPDLQIHSFSSSVHLTHLLQGSGQRTPDTRSETIPSSRITPDLQIHIFSSSVHSLIFYRVQVREHLTRDQRPFLHPESLQIFRFTASPLQFTSLVFYRVQIREHLTRDQRPFLHPESLQIFRFTASPLQFTHSSSTGFRSENTWHEIRDHSFIQNHSRSSDSQLLLFSSPHSSSTGFRSENTWHEIRDHSFIQNHSRPFRFTASPLQFTSLIFYRVQIREHLTRDQRPFLHPESLQIFRFTASPLQFTSLIFYRVQVREHLTRDQRPFLHPESLQIFRFTSSPLQFTHSSSTGFRSENTWHEIRDHSFIQNHSRSSDSQLLLFSSPHSSSTGFRSENTWHEIRDHSFIQNHYRSSDSQLLLFSSLTHLLQGSDQRTPDTRSETIPSSRITPDLQIHSFFSSVHLTHLLQGSDQRTPVTRSETIPSSRITPDLQIHSFSSSVHLTHLLQGSGQRTPDKRSETIPSSRITPDPSDSQLLLFSSPHSSSTGFRSENTWHEIRDHSFIQNHSRSFRFTASPLQFTSLIFYRVQAREHLTRDQRPFLHPESLQIFRFTASSLQFTHSSSTGFRSENTWQEIRDHSFIQNHSRSFRFTASSLQFTSLIFYRVQVREHLTRDQRPFLHPESLQTLQIHSFFSSVHLTHLLQGSGQRTPDTRSETIPSSRITPDLQIHSFFSSVHLTHLLQGSDQRTPDPRSEIIPSSRITPDPSDSHLLLFSSPHSSSTGFRSENTWQEIRDHSFIQNHSRSSDSQLLLFSSLTHLLQGSDQRTPDTRSETIPSSRITPDPSDSQLLLFSSPHSSSTGFRSENTWQEIRDHSFIQNLSRSSDSQLLLFSSPHSSSTGFSSENTWHEIRDHSFIQNHSRSSDSQLLLFSSLTHLLQGSDQRTPDLRSETIPSSRITPDLQIHSFSSSVHSLIFYRVQVREHLTRDQRPFLHPESLQIFRFTASPLQFTSLVFYRVQIREHLTRDQRPFLHPESLQIFRFTASSLQFTSLIFYRVQVREHLTRDQRPFLHPESLQIFRFTASSLQFTSLIFYRVQIREHLTRDQRSFLHPESLQILQIHIFFSSVHLTHLLQGSDQRTPDKRSETIPSSRITPDLQIHSFFSSVHSLIFYRVQIREHLTRDQRPFLHPESLQTLQIHSFSSSVHLTHLLQGSDQRTPDKRSETIPSSRISPDLQIHSFSSSVHLTHLLQGSVQRTPDTRSETIPSSRITPDLQIHSFFSSVHSLIFYRVQIREHLTWDQRPFLHPESLQIFRFTASPLQFTHSSSTGFRSENTWHEIRDHSFIQNHSRSSDSQLLLFSSPHSSSTGFRSENTWHEIRDHSFIQNHYRSSDSQLLLFSSLTHLLQGSDQRTPDTRSETIPSSRITPDLQIHSFFSSVHSLIFYRVQIREHLTRDQRPFLHPESLQIFRFTASSLQFTHSSSTGFRSEDWNGHSRSLVLCSVTHFCVVFEVCVWIIVWLEQGRF